MHTMLTALQYSAIAANIVREHPYTDMVTKKNIDIVLDEMALYEYTVIAIVWWGMLIHTHFCTVGFYRKIFVIFSLACPR